MQTGNRIVFTLGDLKPRERYSSTTQNISSPPLYVNMPSRHARQDKLQDFDGCNRIVSKLKLATVLIGDQLSTQLDVYITAAVQDKRQILEGCSRIVPSLRDADLVITTCLCMLCKCSCKVCYTGQAPNSGGLQQDCAEPEGCGGGGGLGGPAPLQAASAHRARAQAGRACCRTL